MADEFVWTVDNGLRRVPRRSAWSTDTRDRLLRRLDKLDTVRNQGAVEARFAYLEGASND